jgi:hypothetical protein
MDFTLKKIILVKKLTMEYPEDEKYPAKRPVFLTVLCILTFIGSGWALMSAVISYNSASSTVSIYHDSVINRKTIIKVDADTLKIENETDSLMDSSKIHSDISSADSSSKEFRNDTKAEDFNMGKIFGEKMQENILDMISVEKLQKSAIGSFAAALFTLAGAIFMWFLKRSGFYLYIFGIIIGIVVPFYIYGDNLLAIGIGGFGSFFGLVFIALYALNLKSMK